MPLEVAFDARHVCKASGWHLPRGSPRRLPTSAGSLGEAASGSTACRRKALSRHEGEDLQLLVSIEAVKGRVNEVILLLTFDVLVWP